MLAKFIGHAFKLTKLCLVMVKETSLMLGLLNSGQLSIWLTSLTTGEAKYWRPVKTC